MFDLWFSKRHSEEFTTSLPEVFKTPEDIRRWQLKESIDNLLKTQPLFLQVNVIEFDNTAEVIEIAIINWRGETILNSFVKPINEIPLDQINSYQFSISEVNNAPTWREIWPTVYRILQGKTVGIFDARFNFRAIKKSCEQNNIEWNEPVAKPFCIMRLYAAMNRRLKKFLPESTSWFSLEWARQHEHIAIKNYGRAVDEARIARMVFMNISDSISEYLSFSNWYGSLMGVKELALSEDEKEEEEILSKLIRITQKHDNPDRRWDAICSLLSIPYSVPELKRLLIGIANDTQQRVENRLNAVSVLWLRGHSDNLTPIVDEILHERNWPSRSKTEILKVLCFMYILKGRLNDAIELMAEDLTGYNGYWNPYILRDTGYGVNALRELVSKLDPNESLPLEIAHKNIMEIINRLEETPKSV